jgi:hypothetical protein
MEPPAPHIQLLAVQRALQLWSQARRTSLQAADTALRAACHQLQSVLDALQSSAAGPEVSRLTRVDTFTVCIMQAAGAKGRRRRNEHYPPPFSSCAQPAIAPQRLPWERLALICNQLAEAQYLHVRHGCLVPAEGSWRLRKTPSQAPLPQPAKSSARLNSACPWPLHLGCAGASAVLSLSWGRG